MRNRILFFLSITLATNCVFGQERKFIVTNYKEVLYSYDKKDSSFIFKMPYIMDEFTTDESINIQIGIDSVTIIDLNEIPYNSKDKEFIIVIPKAYVKDILKSKTIDLDFMIHAYGDMEWYIKGNFMRCLSGKIISDNME